MELQQQVTNLELSKRMKELGFKQKSFARWEVYTDPNTNRKKKLIVLQGGHTFGDVYSAYTVSELGEMLPMYLKIKEEFWDLIMIKAFPEYGVRYENSNHIEYIGAEGGAGILDKSEANARAKMLIYLKENNLL